MSLAQIMLTTNKTTSNVGDYVRKIGQDERGQVLPVIVVDATGTPYDLSDKKRLFRFIILLYYLDEVNDLLR